MNLTRPEVTAMLDVWRAAGPMEPDCMAALAVMQGVVLRRHNALVDTLAEMVEDHPTKPECLDDNGARCLSCVTAQAIRLHAIPPGGPDA